MIQRSPGLARRALVLLGAAAVMFGVPVPAAGQQTPSGRLVGRVIDARTGAGLADAGVQVVGTTLGTMSGVDGRFSVGGVPAGTVTLQVRRLGYGPKTVTGIVLDVGASVEQSISLEPATVQLEATVVTASAERGSVSEALDAQRTATGIVNAITSEQIARSPDGDAAQAVQRVSGVTVQDGRYVFVRGLGERYTTTSLNGARMPSPEPERKVVPLDLFPAGLLQSITTSKTFTPDLPGDFSGAQVDIRTREFPARRSFTYSATMGYNTVGTGSSVLDAAGVGGEWLASAGGERRLPAAVRVGGNFQQIQLNQGDHNRLVGAFRNAWSPGVGSGRPNSSLSASFGGNDPVLFGRRLGYLLSGTYSYSQDVRTNQVRALADRGGEPGATVEIDRFEGESGIASVLWGGLANFSTLFGTHTRLSLNNTYNRTADNEARTERGSFENLGIPARIDRMIYVEREVRSNQLAAEHQFGDHHRLDWSATASGVRRDEPDRSELVYEIVEDGSGRERLLWLNASSAGAVRTFSELDERALEGRADYQLSFGTGRRGLLKIGGLMRRTDRDADTRAFNISASGLGDDVRALPPEQIFGAGQLDFQLAPLFQGGAYQAEDRLSAGYAMTEIDLGARLRLVAGARIERADVTVDAQSTLGSPVTTEKSWTDVLPSLALTYRPSDEQNVRLSLSRTLARPEYREMTPIKSRDVLGGDDLEGNPGLERTRIANADLRWEWYPTAGEILSVGLFAKRFDQPIERLYRAGGSGTRTLIFVNADRADSYGVELEARKGLGFLTDALSPLTLFSNLTVMRSEITLGETQSSATSTERSMVGQAPYVVNTGVTYTTAGGGTSATLLFNRVGGRIQAAGDSPLPDVVEVPRNVMDFSLRFPVFGDVSGRFDARNLLDAPYRVEQGSVVRQSYRTGRIVQFGLTWRP